MAKQENHVEFFCKKHCFVTTGQEPEKNFNKIIHKSIRIDKQKIKNNYTKYIML